MQAMIDLAPAQYESDAIYQPLRSLLGLQNLERNLTGFQGGYLPTDPATGAFTGGLQGLPGYTRPPATPTPGTMIGGTDGAPARPAGDTGGVRDAGGVRTADPAQVAGPTLGSAPTMGGDGANVSVAGPSLNYTLYPGQSPGGDNSPPAGATTTPVGTRVWAGDSPLAPVQGQPYYQWNGSGWEEYRGGGAFGGPARATGTILNTLPAGYNYDGPGGTPTTGVPTGGQEGTTGTYVAPQRGLLDIFENDVTPSITRMQTEASRDLRNATMADASRLAPGLRENFDAANPEQAALLAQLNTLASEGMDDGLTAYETRAAQQAARGAQSARGFGYGGNDAFDEAMKLALDTQQRREANRQFGLQVAGANNAVSIDPWAAITGTSSQGAAAGAAGGFYRPPAGTMFDPFNAYASDLNSSNQNAAAAESQANNIFGNLMNNL